MFIINKILCIVVVSFILLYCFPPVNAYGISDNISNNINDLLDLKKVNIGGSSYEKDIDLTVTYKEIVGKIGSYAVNEKYVAVVPEFKYAVNIYDAQTGKYLFTYSFFNNITNSKGSVMVVWEENTLCIITSGMQNPNMLFKVSTDRKLEGIWLSNNKKGFSKLNASLHNITQISYEDKCYHLINGFNGIVGILPAVLTKIEVIDQYNTSNTITICDYTDELRTEIYIRFFGITGAIVLSPFAVLLIIKTKEKMKKYSQS